MSITSRLRNRQPQRRPRARFRPQLESLDGRVVPSTLRVTNYSDNPTVKGSLRYEVAHANPNGKDTIVFNVAGEFHLNSELLITRGVTIKGSGAGLVTLTSDFNPDDLFYGYLSPRALEVNASQPVVISGITIFNNFQASGPTSSMGGAVYNYTTLTMSGCDLSDNGANSGGAVYNAGTMTLTNCTLKDDRADVYGGCVYNAGTLTVTGCTFSFDGAYGFNYPGGAIYNAGTLSIGTSTFVMDDNAIVGPYADLGGNTFITQQPLIGSFTASASSVTAGDSLTLTASNITDANPNSSVTQVLIYGPNSIGGIPLGYAVLTSPGVWTFKFSTMGLAPGTDTFYAVAVDSYGVSSAAVGVNVQVV